MRIRWIPYVIAGVALLAALAVLARDPKTLDLADKYASVLSLIVAGTALHLGRRRQPPVDADGEEAARKLAEHVKRQWQQEIGVRLLRHPRPLRLRWSPSRSTAAGVPQAKPGRLDRDGHAAQHLVALVRRTRPRQLVVLGEPGSGKSSLMALFVVDAIDLRHTGDPVPVLLALPTWDAGEPLDEWIARRIDEDYPGRAGRLVREQRILPVLDGLDELPLPALHQAFDELNRIAPIMPGLVVTSRPGEYDDVVSGRGPLSAAAVVRIEHVAPDDAVAFLTESDLRGSARWAPVADRLRRDPRGDLATTFANPLMISLARSAYQSPKSDPRLLLTMDAGTLERHLLEKFLTNAYPGDAPRRWLTVLAAGTRLRWWTLATQVHPTVIVVTIGLLVAALGAAAGGGFAALSGYRPGVATAYAAVTGLAVGVLAGRRAARVHQPPGMLAVVAAALRDGLVSGAIFAVGATVVLMSATSEPAVEFFGPFGVVGVVGGSLLGIISNGLAAGRRMVPQRFGRRLGALPRRLVEGCLTAVPFTVPVATVVAALNAVDRWDPERGWLAVLPQALLDTLVIGAAGALVVGVPVGVGRWLSVPGEADEGTDGTATFRSSLRAERETLLVTTAGAALAVGAVTAAVVGLAGAGLAGVGGGSPAVAAAVAAALAATLVAVLAAFGSGAPWVAYTISRLWLAARGRLPWDLTGFLEAAHRHEVLRQDGPAYRFRHDRLRSHLAGAPPLTPRRDRYAAHRRGTVVTAFAGVVLMLVTGVTVVPDALESVAAKLAATACRVSITVDVTPEYQSRLVTAVRRFNESRSAVCQPVWLVSGSRDPLATPDPDQAQVWIPVSSAMVDLLRSREPGVVADGDFDRHAYDPLVLAVPASAAQRFDGVGWPDVAGYLREATSSPRVVVPNPTRSISGLNTVYGLREVVGATAAKVASAEITSAEVTRGVADLFAKATVTEDETRFLCAGSGSADTVVITREEIVSSANRGESCRSGRPTFRWATIRLTDGALPADMPYAVLSSASRAQRLLAEDLKKFLRERIAHVWPYPPRETPGRANTRARLAPGLPAQVAALWETIRPPVTSVLLVDTSGSMAGRAGFVMLAAVQGGVNRLRPVDRLGLWTFSDRSGGGDSGIRAHVPTGPAADVRERVSQELARQRAAGAGTDPHAAILAVREHVRETEPATRPVNVIVVTDGQDTSRIPAGEVIFALRRQDGPIVRVIGILPDSASPLVIKGLTEISEASGGATFTTATSDDVAEALRTALSLY
ncbi:VWA domain-containing protein [Micromonospora sp. WMMD1120]|uniref:VWA domain-containing protein n=1 Tax=Micromonospora sp. WMMD1120 TaxID=3016106 RepID=UPI002416CB91|nr:VWA domain-containing protein [Micromonospora sp. WMMD1120]MDG4808745.1 VWA domain-containing protein [Micromonospora sp. WMMD1120]